MDLPLNLLILRTIQGFGTLPVPLLYRKLPAASRSDIDRKLRLLEAEGVISIDGDQVSSTEASSRVRG